MKKFLSQNYCFDITRKLFAQIGDSVRALIRNGIFVKEGTKLGEVDPRPDPELCNIIRARMRTIAGGVLEAILFWYNK